MSIADELQEGIERELVALGYGVAYSMSAPLDSSAEDSVAPQAELTPAQRQRQERRARAQERKQQKIEARIEFLIGFQQHIRADPGALRFVDDIIGNRVQAAEKRQQESLHAALQEQAASYEALLHKQQADAKASSRLQYVFSVAASVASLVAGWLLSALSPVSALAHLIPK